MSLSPYDNARLVYESEPCARTFEQDLLLHLRHGYVVSTPKCFAMARPVMREWEYSKLTNPAVIAEQPDCWWIYLLAGDLKTALRWIPYPLPWIGYERQNVPRFFEASKFPLRPNHESVKLRRAVV